MELPDTQYLYSNHGNNLNLLKKKFGGGMFTMRQALDMGIGHVEFAIMCADGILVAAWCPRGAFQVAPQFLC